ncbi:MAG: hypothetical protein EON93_19400 [Burkholderiales bacterium]|nr:MAG: hypothetical protein EON93_19400 [Burkholderiales bacterium]
MGFWVFIGIWVTLNVAATRALLRAASVGFERPGMHIAMVWIAPFMGAGMALLDASRYQRANREAVQSAALLDAEAGPPPSTDLALPGGRVVPLRAALAQVNGFPLLNWQTVNAELAGLGDAERPVARAASQRLWLEHMRHALGPHFRLTETDHAFVLSSLEEGPQRAIASYIASTRKKVTHLLNGLAAFPAEGKSVLLVLDDEEWYYHYVSVYYPSEGEFAFSGGMFINAGCPHFVVRRSDLAQIEPVIAHELTHSALAHLKLPLWLDEGIAVNTERRIAGAQPSLHTPREIDGMQRRFWGQPEIQQFWSGESFQRTDDGNLLSYELARVMVEQMARDWQPFAEFVRDAQRSDAGAASALQHLKIDLGAAAAALTGQLTDAGWSPRWDDLHARS